VSHDLEGAHGPSRPLPFRQRARLNADEYSAEAVKVARAARLQRNVAAEAAYNLLKAKADHLVQRAVTRSKENGALLTLYPSYMNGTELSQEEFQNNLRLQL
jgi:hypothetical protein